MYTWLVKLYTLKPSLLFEVSINYKYSKSSTDRYTYTQTGPTYQVSSLETRNTYTKCESLILIHKTAKGISGCNIWEAVLSNIVFYKILTKKWDVLANTFQKRFRKHSKGHKVYQQTFVTNILANIWKKFSAEILLFYQIFAKMFSTKTYW